MTNPTHTKTDVLERRELNGRSIKCARCDGHGIVSTWSFGVKEPDECKDCGGSGSNWQYSKGAIAMFYGGPLIGRALTNTHPDKQGT